MIYNWNDDHAEYKCPVCNYEYHEYPGSGQRQTTAGSDPFIELHTKATYTTGSYYTRRLEETTVYACPKCGTLQIQV